MQGTLAPVEVTFPAAHVLQIVTLLKRWEIGADELLAGLGVTEAELEAPHARVPLATLREVSERARSLTGEPGIGFYLGLQKRLSMYGYLGFATMAAGTLREGLALAVRYTPAVTTGISLELREHGDTATLVIEEHASLGGARDIGLFSLVVGIRQMTAALTGREPGRVTVDLPLAKPDYFDRFAHLLPDVRFDQPVTRIHFNARALDLPFVAPDRAALRLASEACERQLVELGFDHSLPMRVRRVAKSDEGFRTIDQVARALRLSERTLKRKLAAQGVTFSELIDRERHELAIELLRSTDRSLEAVAEHLGYSTLPNFARAFRRWEGTTPAQYRKHTRALAHSPS